MAEGAINPDDELVVTMLVAGQEVGRSCHLLEFKGKKILHLFVISRFLRDSLLKIIGQLDHRSGHAGHGSLGQQRRNLPRKY